MPSKSYKTYISNLKQVDRLLRAFVDMRPPQRGRKHLDHFTRSALIFLCSAWEVYIEQIAKECGTIICNRSNSPQQLPDIVQKELSNVVKSSRHELEPFIFANDWKKYYLQKIAEYTDRLNTPKKDKVMELMNKHLGISGDFILQSVPSLVHINDIVKLRGEIAHNIYAENYLSSDIVNAHYITISNAVKEIEIMLWQYIADITTGHKPWQKIYP